MRSLIKKILKESNNEWFEGLSTGVPEDFAITFCETEISTELLNRFINSVPHYTVSTRFDGLWDENWVKGRIRYESGRVVLYFVRNGNTILWMGWDDCKNNSIKKYDYVFTIDEFLKIFER